MNQEQEVLNAFERGKAFGFAEGMKSMHLKELTDDLRIKELESEIERLQDQLNEFLVARDLAILRKAQEK